MAPNATIFKALLHIADVDRHYYQDHPITLARHPSETDERMMVRLLAFVRHADEALSFGRGLSTDDEPALWQKDLTGQIVGGYDFISSSATARDGNGRDSNPADEGDWYGNNECGIGYPASDSSWHGTHVAGTVAALTNTAKGVASMAYSGSLMGPPVIGAIAQGMGMQIAIAYIGGLACLIAFVASRSRLLK